jgi:hypothetical protein
MPMPMPMPMTYIVPTTGAAALTMPTSEDPHV